MGYDPFILHAPHISGKLDGATRKKLGVVLPSEAQRKWQTTQEKAMHEEFEQWLRLHHDELYWDHSRMDRATSNRVGHPDFVIQRQGKVLNIEAKANGKVLTEKQRDVHAWIKSTGGEVYICYSSAEAIQLTRSTFGI